MKFIKIASLLLFASALGASAQLPAKRTLPKKNKAEVVATQADAEESAQAEADAATVRAAAAAAARQNPRTGRLNNQGKNEAGTPAGAPALPTPPRATPAAPVQKAGAAQPAQQDKPAAPQTKPAQPQTKPAQPQNKPAQAPAGRPGAQAAQSAPAAGVSYREFPTAATMPDDAAWRRDVYRTVDLTREANATLYFPVTPSAGRQNLFVYLFRQVLRGNIKAYEYTLDANEHFDEEHQIKGRKIMDTHNIYYEVQDNKIRVNDADLPSEDVKLWFVKESVYYDQHTASFRTKVTALCPVMVSGMSEFGEEETQRVPLFWINYEEAAPYLAKLSLMGSSVNNASAISADDYFTMNRYQGDIYKTTNLQDRIIAQYAETEEEQHAERRRIENELTGFEKHVWGHEPERLLDVYGNPVLDSEGKPLTYNLDGQLVDSRGRRVAFAVAGKDSLNVASDTPEVDPLPAIVLVNERGFAVDEEGNPLLKADGSPIEMTDEYPAPEAIAQPAAKGKTSAPAGRRGSAPAATTRRTTTAPAKSSGAKSSSAKSSGAKTPAKSSAKAPKASKPAPAKSQTSGGLSVRRERH